MRRPCSPLILLLSFFLRTTADSANGECRGDRPGDCNPLSCGGSCEARYIRFYDRGLQGDRTIKTCQCVETRTCSIIGMHAAAGCRSYSSLSTAAQRFIRNWSIDSRDRKNRHSNDIHKRFSDKVRHHQLINGNSRFCCKSANPTKARVLRLRSSSEVLSYLLSISLLLSLFI